MKKKDIQELKHRTSAELEALIKESSEKLRGLRFDLAAGKVKDITQIHEAKKKIARMKTFISQNNGKAK